MQRVIICLVLACLALSCGCVNIPDEGNINFNEDEEDNERE